MKVIANVPLWNGNHADPAGLGRSPRYIAEGAGYWDETARAYAALGCDVRAMLPAGSKVDERMMSNLAAMDPRLACEMGTVNHRIRDAFGVAVGVYVGFALDATPGDVGMGGADGYKAEDGWKYPDRGSWKQREGTFDQYETARMMGWSQIDLDGVSSQYVRPEDAVKWMDDLAERTGCVIGGEAFLADWGADGKPTFRYDLMHGRPFCALLPWIERHGFTSKPGEPWSAWLNGHAKPTAPWFSREAVEELTARVRLAGFERVIIDVWDAKPESVQFVRWFQEAGA